MTNPTSNYGFVLPTSSDLVTDLPADFEVALQGVDTRLKALQPGTTLGDLAYSSATANTNTRLAVGTTGQVLAVAAGVPTWTTVAAGGGMTLISTATPSAVSAVDFTSLDSSYKEFFVEWGGIGCSTTDTYDFRFNADSGSNYHSYGFITTGGAAPTFAETNTTSTWGTPGIIGTYIASNNFQNASKGYLRIFNSNNGSSFKTFEAMSAFYNGATGWQVLKGVGVYKSVTAISQINIVRIAGSGTLSTVSDGGIRLWGIK
jgi:hypothetical protein